MCNVSVKEFTPSLINRDDSSINASCHVVINNQTPVERLPGAASTIETQATTPASPQYPSVVSNPDLSDHLAVCFSKILKTNNPQLIANVIDMSGKVIIPINDLAKAVSLITHQDYSKVKISYVENDAKCCSKINPIHSIAKIKIDTQDFNLNWNSEYNILEDTYNISLEKVYVPVAISYV